MKNRFATLVGVQLQTKTGAFNEIKPNLKLAGVSAGIQTGQPGVIATVQNPMPTYWGKMKWRARVYRRDSKKVIMRRTTTNYAVAPSSHLDFGILQKKGLGSGRLHTGLADHRTAWPLALQAQFLDSHRAGQPD
ncbi:WxL protein host-binding domain-containing protein [Lacticaseibacillus nasuensis]|uniref:WxL protein host-binding domain-containing protein n=1 Tax=Lacticaseibacillus nasuensis TaxID=944671 RepID=UPI0015858D28|nr:DUF3324 domain-containing protein [Lacticaseibacillus nasuensis]